MQTKICTAKHSNIHATQGSQTAKLLLISSGMGCIILPQNLKIDSFWQSLSKFSQIPPEWGSKNTPLRSHSS